MTLELRGVSYRYPGSAREAVREVDLRVEAGEVVGVTGASEAGKSTLCLVASGFAPAFIGGALRGELVIDSRPATGLAPHELAALVGLVFQDAETQRSGTTSTVFEEVALGPVNLGLNVAESVARTREALSGMGIVDLARRHPRHLSGGQAQLMAVASIVAMRPRYLALDEPTAQLDDEATKAVLDAVRRLATAGTGVLVADVGMELVDRLADRVVHLEAGRLVASTAGHAVPGTAPIPPTPLRATNRPTPRITVEGVAHVYADGTRALDGIDLEIPPGQRVAITGRTGSGKSTLVQHLDGLLRPSAGRVLFDGADIRDRRVAWLASTVGLAFQDPDRQIFAGTVGAEVEFGPRNLGRRDDELREGVTAALRSVGLEGAEGTNPYDLGYARRKLLAIASVLAMDTPIVVLDEPTAGQDARGVTLIERVVSDLAAAGRTVIAISHDRGFISRSFDRVVVLADGRVAADGPPDVVPASIG